MIVLVAGTVHGDSDRTTAVDVPVVDEPRDHAAVHDSLNSPDCTSPCKCSEIEVKEPEKPEEPDEVQPVGLTQQAQRWKQSQERSFLSVYMWSETVWYAYVSYAPDNETKVTRMNFAHI